MQRCIVTRKIFQCACIQKCNFLRYRPANFFFLSDNTAKDKTAPEKKKTRTSTGLNKGGRKDSFPLDKCPTCNEALGVGENHICDECHLKCHSKMCRFKYEGKMLCKQCFEKAKAKAEKSKANTKESLSAQNEGQSDK